MTDFYVQDKSRLNGQPKRTIGNYVESQGFLVPRRFDTLQEARASGLAILCRSEHIQEYESTYEYDSVCGLLESKLLENVSKTKNKYKLKKHLLKDVQPEISRFCELTKIDPKTFTRQISFSYWELLSGFNHTIVADSSVENRYYITTNSGLINNGPRTIVKSISDNGKVNIIYKQFASDKMISQTPKRIEFYEQIRHLPHFDANHCPIIEMQTIEDKHYFLQYHRSRDFNPSTFTLDREPQQNEIKAHFVRGATSPEGEIVKAIVCRPTWNRGDKFSTKLEYEQAIVDVQGGYQSIFSEITLKSSPLLVVDREKKLCDGIIGHGYHSRMFKPKVSLETGGQLLGNDDEILQRKADATRENQYVELYFISDGRKAYVRRI